MKPLILLVVVFALALLWTLIFQGNADHVISGRIAMGVMLIFTAIGHFRFAEGMAMMLPASIPLRKPLVYFTGIIEVVAGIGLLLPTWTKLYGWLLILFLILVLPANIYASLKRVDYEKATYGGPGPSYLWFRVPLQIFFIVWVYYFAVLNAPGLNTHILHNFLRVHS
jgi:uncharacterized membrane protein